MSFPNIHEVWGWFFSPTQILPPPEELEEAETDVELEPKLREPCRTLGHFRADGVCEYGCDAA